MTVDGYFSGVQCFVLPILSFDNCSCITATDQIREGKVRYDEKGQSTQFFSRAA